MRPTLAAALLVLAMPMADTRAVESEHADPPQAGEESSSAQAVPHAVVAVGNDVQSGEASADPAATTQLVEDAVRIAERQAAPDRGDVERAARDSATNDARILAAVNVALARAPAIPDVGVNVNSGVVTLSGSVIDDAQRERAGRLAKGVRGVTEVDNQLQLSMDLGTRLRATLHELQRKATRWLAGTPLLIVAVLMLLAAHWIGRFVSTHLAWLRLDSRNPYLDGVVSRVVYLVVLVSGAVMALDLLGATKLVGALLGSAGVIGLALGFAFKDIAENYIAGIMLSLRRPFAPGDWVDVDGHEGRVVSLSSRATILMTQQGNHVRLPNGLVFKAVIVNYTRNPKRRVQFRTEIDASESISQAQDVAIAAMRQVEGVLDDPPPRVLVREYGAAGTVIEAQAWIDQTATDFVKASSAMIHAVKAAFGKAHIEPARNTQFVVNAGTLPAIKAENHSAVAATDTAAASEIDAQLAQAQREQADSNLIAHSRDRDE